MLAERIFFNVLAFFMFVYVFGKMIQKNDSNYIILLVIQALGIAISFLELLFGIMEWTLVKTISYLMSIGLPILFFYLDNKNINMLEKIYILRIKLYIKNNADIKAKKMLIELVTKYPESYLGHKLLADLYEKEGGMRKAIDEYVKAIDIQKNDYDSYFKIAELLNSLTRKDEAISMLENLLHKKPDYTRATNLLGDLLIEKERYKEAVGVYLDAIKYKGDDFDLYYNLGIVYTHLNDFKSAKIAYDKAAEINHLNYTISYNLGKISLIYNDLDAAEKYFIQAIYGEEVEAMAYYELAKIYMLKKDKEKAILFLEKAIELDELYEKKLDEDVTFIPIRAYIEKKGNRISKEREKLTPKEQKVIEHLNNTFNVVEKLNNINKNEIKIDFSKEFKGRQR